MFSALCLLTSAGILFFILKYRIHLHVTYQSRSTKSASGRSGSSRKSIHRSMDAPESGSRKAVVRGLPEVHPSIRPIARNEAPENHGSTARKQDLISALKNQGCTPSTARRAVERAMFHQDPDLADALRRAIDYAREAA